MCFSHSALYCAARVATVRLGVCTQVEANADESDEMAADRSWQAHLQRNDSFIVDTMHGQYKSVRRLIARCTTTSSVRERIALVIARVRQMRYLLT